MVQKKLQKDSEFNKFDMDGDGVVTDEELDMERRMLELEDLRSDMENDDKRQDAQRNMVCFVWNVTLSRVYYRYRLMGFSNRCASLK